MKQLFAWTDFYVPATKVALAGQEGSTRVPVMTARDEVGRQCILRESPDLFQEVTREVAATFKQVVCRPIL